MGIRVIGKGSWEKREVGKFKVERSEVAKFLFKLERAQRSWKEPSEVGNFGCSWNVLTEVRKFK